MSHYSKVNLNKVEDSAAKYGHGDNHEARFVTKSLSLTKAGMSLQKLLPGKRSPFGHKHTTQEEILVVIAGSGRMKLDDKIIKLKPYDAVRIPPGTMQACVAGSKGMEFIIFGAPKLEERDFEITKGWWPSG